MVSGRIARGYFFPNKPRIELKIESEDPFVTGVGPTMLLFLLTRYLQKAICLFSREFERFLAKKKFLSLFELFHLRLNRKEFLIY